MNSHWKIHASPKDLEELKKAILARRGVVSAQDIDLFLEDEHPLNFLRHFDSGFKEALKQAKSFIEARLAENIPVVIMGDYDADGICATSILYNFLRKERQYERTFFFIPNRFDHGYGLSRASVDAAVEKVAAELGDCGKMLFISVDSGITSVDEVAYIKDLGHDIIITDHHQKPLDLPSADLIVWSDNVVGAVIAWLLGRVLGSKNSGFLALAALATVTDVHPLTGMSRALVRRGLRIINTAPPPGLKELIQVSGLSGKEITTQELGWVLGPRINAAGRLEDASTAVRLFTEVDSRVRFQIAQNLDRINRDRQDETQRMYSLVSSYADLPRFILAVEEDFHEGIIGLVASRLVRDYHRPSIVVSLNGKYGKGSVRSIPGINIIELLREFEDLFENLGGHPMAAGFTIAKDKIAQLDQGLQQVFKTRFSDEAFVPSIDVEAEISLHLVDWPVFGFLESLRPFGEGNRSPRFVSRNLGIANIDFVGKDKTHTSLKLYDGEKYQKAIFFSSRDRFEDLGLGDYIDVVYSIKLNEYRGNRSLDLFVEDFRVSG